MTNHTDALLDITRLRDESTLGTSLAVGGVSVGQRASAALRAAPLTRAWAKESPRRVQREGEVFEGSDNGEEREVSLSASIEAALQRGGWVQTEDVAWDLLPGGIVDRITVQGPALDALDIQTEPQIARCLGAADWLEYSAGRVTYHYERRKFAVTWDRTHQRLSLLVLGGEPWIAPRLSATDLAVQLVEGWERLEQYGWREPPSNDLPALIRFRRISALVRAFELPSIEAITNGEFLAGALRDRYADLIQGLVASAGVTPRYRSCADLPYLYRYLLAYRRSAQSVLTHNAGWLTCGDEAMLGVLNVIEDVNEKVVPLLTSIDRLLGQFLDPTLRTIDQRVLMREHGYLHANLEGMTHDDE